MQLVIILTYDNGQFSVDVKILISSSNTNLLHIFYQIPVCYPAV